MEPGSDQARSIWDGAARIASSRLLYVEVRALLAGARRAGRLRRRTHERARHRLEDLSADVNFVELGPDLARLAGDLAERHRLRAGDAVHLASAVTLGDPKLALASWDTELRRAAREAGLAITPGNVS